MTNALIKLMRDKLGDALAKDVIYQGCEFLESKSRTKISVLRKYAKNNDEISKEISKLRVLIGTLEEIEDALK